MYSQNFLALALRFCVVSDGHFVWYQEQSSGSIPKRELSPDFQALPEVVGAESIAVSSETTNPLIINDVFICNLSSDIARRARLVSGKLRMTRS